MTVAAAPSVNLFSAVTYRTLTDFVKVPLPTVIPAGGVTFQARDSAGDIVGSYVLPANTAALYGTVSITTSRRRTITLVIKGAIGATGTGAPGVFPVANY